MNDAEILHDAFAELERQADVVSMTRVPTRSAPLARRVRAPRRAYLVAATVVVVLAVASVVALLGSSTGPEGDGGPPAGGVQSTAATSTAPGSAAPSSADASPTSTTPHSHAATTPASPYSSASASSSVSSGGSVVPRNRQAMVQAFTRVLGPGVRFTVAESDGNYIKGVLTVVKSGQQGGYDIQASQGKPGDQPICEDADDSHCVIRTTQQGGTLSTGRETMGKATLYLVDYVRPDGASFLMHVSNQQDPKGAGPVLGTNPPLTRKQVAAVVESDRW